ncbi:hypothetical protein ACFLS9_04140 [Bacteroidota bacterium]
MVTIVSLWLPILLSAVVVWIASFVVWTILPHHKSDFKSFPDEESTRNSLKPQNLSPGQYNIPHVPSRESLKDEEFRKKFEDGPVGFFTVLPSKLPDMGKPMVQSFLYFLIVGFIVAYIASRTISGTADYLAVFRVVGTVTWLAYGTGVVLDSIWFGRPWGFTIKHLLDSLFYGLLTAGIFGWLWPH